MQPLRRCDRRTIALIVALALLPVGRASASLIETTIEPAGPLTFSPGTPLSGWIVWTAGEDLTLLRGKGHNGEVGVYDFAVNLASIAGDLPVDFGLGDTEFIGPGNSGNGSAFLTTIYGTNSWILELKLPQDVSVDAGQEIGRVAWTAIAKEAAPDLGGFTLSAYANSGVALYDRGEQVELNVNASPPVSLVINPVADPATLALLASGAILLRRRRA